MKSVKVFISFDYKHKKAKNKIKGIIESRKEFKDITIDYKIKSKTDEEIRIEIRDKYIADAKVLVVLVTDEAWGRKFIDWEIAAAMYDGQERRDGKRNDICGIVAIDYVKYNCYTSSEVIQEKNQGNDWVDLTAEDINRDYQHFPKRIITALENDAQIEVISIHDVKKLIHESILSANRNKANNIGKLDYTNLRVKNAKRR